MRPQPSRRLLSDTAGLGLSDSAPPLSPGLCTPRPVPWATQQGPRAQGAGPALEHARRPPVTSKDPVEPQNCPRAAPGGQGERDTFLGVV